MINQIHTDKFKFNFLVLSASIGIPSAAKNVLGLRTGMAAAMGNH
jgi:hypothetical protein